MTLKAFRTMALTLLFAGLLVSCAKKETTTTAEVTTPPPSATETTAPLSDPIKTAATDTAPAGEPIGVAECDTYLTKYLACVSDKVPEASRAQLKASIQQTRDSWRQVAANPQTRASLVQACKSSQEATKQAMAAYGCTF